MEDIEEVEPDEDELMIIKRYINGDDEFRPMMSSEDVKKELNL